MNDAENLSKLLSCVAPAVFRDFMIAHFHLAMPELDAKLGKRAQRAQLEAVLTALAAHDRRKIEDVAERIVLLSDRPGQDVVAAISQEITDEAAQAEFGAITNQYERALWLYLNATLLFDEAHNARQADLFRQSTRCYSGFIAPRDLTVLDDEDARQAYLHAMAEHLGCAPDTVAVQVFRRLRAETAKAPKVELYQISAHHNRPPEIIEKVEGGELVAQEVVSAISLHITYEPATGHLEVLSKDTDGREALARIAADKLLQSPISGDTIPLKQYDYQSLAARRSFDLTGENVTSVKVIQLGYSTPEHRSVLVKIWAKDPEDIYTAARSLISLSFDFRHHVINYAKLSLRIPRIGAEKAHSIAIELRGDNKCSVKTKREKERALCDRLLERWGFIKSIDDDAAPVHALAA